MHLLAIRLSDEEYEYMGGDIGYLRWLLHRDMQKSRMRGLSKKSEKQKRGDDAEWGTGKVTDTRRILTSGR